MANIHCSHGRRNGHTVPSLIPSMLLPSAPAPLPEATHSVNVFFEVAGYGKAQATGRGATAQDAARHLADTIRETKAALETPAPQSYEQRCADLLACALTKACAKGDYLLVERLVKATALVLSGAVSPGERQGMLAVQSQSCPSHYYEVDGTQCSCPDYQHRQHQQAKAYFCKHGLAAMMYRKLSEVA